MSILDKSCVLGQSPSMSGNICANQRPSAWKCNEPENWPHWGQSVTAMTERLNGHHTCDPFGWFLVMWDAHDV